MKIWLLDKFTGAFGIPITGLISTTVGALVGKAYAIGGGLMEKVPWLHDLANSIWHQVPPEHQIALSPAAVGAVVGAGAFAWIQQMLNRKLRDGNRDVQASINDALPAERRIRVDGLPGQKTKNAASYVSNKARQVSAQIKRGGFGKG